MYKFSRLVTLSFTRACLVLACINSTAFAQVYETTDKQGNPNFSDTPSTNAREIELQQTNTIQAPPPGQSPAPAPAATAATTRPASTSQQENADQQLTPYLVNDNDDDNDRRDDRPIYDSTRPDRPQHLPAEKVNRPIAKPARPALHRE